MTEESPTPPPAPASSGTKLLKDSIWEVYWPKDIHADKVAIPVASFPMIIYFWPTMIAILACAALQPFGVSPTGLGTIATFFLTLNLMVIVTDLDQKKFVIAVLMLILVGAGIYIANLKEMGAVSSVSNWFAGLEITYSTHAYAIIGVVLLIFFLMGMAQPRFNYWRLEPNEFVHYIQPFGRDQSVPRQGSTVSREVPDVLEMILTFNGGTLVIKREGQVVARIEHVPFLGRRMVAIERLLGATRVKTVSS
ncbi:MAG: hypothetical protein ACI841_002496 [Planctomycetota bacterium]|jgi:hypothetical protein